MRRGAIPAAKQEVQPAAAPPRDAQPVARDGWRALRSTDIDSLAGDELKQYAIQAGVMRRDVDGLTENRLRQNVKALIHEHFELLAEG